MTSPANPPEPAKRRSSYVKKNIPTGRKPQAFVRFQVRKNSRGYNRIELQLGRALWYEIGRPERLALEWRGEHVFLIPDEDGWKLHVRQYAGPRCWLPLDIVFTPGKYGATVENGVIALGKLQELT